MTTTSDDDVVHTTSRAWNRVIADGVLEFIRKQVAFYYPEATWGPEPQIGDDSDRNRLALSRSRILGLKHEDSPVIIDPEPFRSPRGKRFRSDQQNGVSWNVHRYLEQRFEGCSVAWDRHPILPTWERPFIVVAHNWTGAPPYQGRVSITDPGHLRHRNQLHVRLHEAQRAGPLMLVAYQLAPATPTWRPACIVVGHDHPPGLGGGTVGVPIHAIYNVQEFRWTLIR